MKLIALRKWIICELTLILAFGLLVFVSDVLGVMDQSHLPPLAKEGKGGLVSGELIFSIEDKPTKECHASTIVETDSGLVAAWFAGTRERDPDVGIWVSRLVNGRWSEPTEVVNGVQSMNLRYPCWNPVLFQPENGPLMLFYKVGPNPREWWGMLTTSEDDGKTWSWPTKLGEHWAVGHLLGPVKNKPIQLEDGSILCPTSTEVELTDDDTRWRVHFEVTSDLGKTWDVIGPIHDGIEFDSIQPSILTYSNGDMQVLCRSMQQVVSQSWSSDGGRSWSLMAATELPNPSAGTDAVTLADGRQLLVYNHTTRKTKIPSRKILNVALSDDGHEWEVALTLEHESNPRPADGRHWGEYSYPAVIQGSDGLVHITYTYNRESVKHVVLNPSEL
ncbi:exo-alpha-sialidase [Opitutia bacterium ISCC 51]|nr:exo-alpha-sialidase [Opitutae bacterium ISCC 51]QXD30129.1 exo-alpha-sialidase [Opitutae bacterium ISCC 52]